MKELLVLVKDRHAACFELAPLGLRDALLLAAVDKSVAHQQILCGSSYIYHLPYNRGLLKRNYLWMACMWSQKISFVGRSGVVEDEASKLIS